MSYDGEHVKVLKESELEQKFGKPESHSRGFGRRGGGGGAGPNPPTGNTIKDPKNWKTGGQPATGAQISYLETLASEAGEDLSTTLGPDYRDTMTKAEIAVHIDRLQAQTGREPVPSPADVAEMEEEAGTNRRYMA